MSAHHSSPSSVEPRYEPRDVSVRAVVGFGIGLVVAGIAIQFGLRWMLHAMEPTTTGPAPRPPSVESSTTIEPRASRAPLEGEVLRDLRVAEDRLLGTYGWVDRDSGMVRIPIDRAMDLVVERGVGAARSRSSER